LFTISSIYCFHQHKNSLFLEHFLLWLISTILTDFPKDKQVLYICGEKNNIIADHYRRWYVYLFKAYSIMTFVVNYYSFLESWLWRLLVFNYALSIEAVPSWWQNMVEFWKTCTCKYMNKTFIYVHYLFSLPWCIYTCMCVHIFVSLHCTNFHTYHKLHFLFSKNK